MKKTIFVTVLSFFTLTAFSQEVFSGKYRQLFMRPYVSNDSTGIKKITKHIDSVEYTILGFPLGNEFRVLVVFDEGRKLLMTQDFFMDGAINKETGFQSWFSKNLTLDIFLWDIFQIKIE